jgi:hypothetical protein
MGKKHNIKLGPHKMSVIRRGGYASTYAKEEEEQLRKQKRMMQQKRAEV